MSQNNLRGVLVDILSDVCKLDDAGKESAETLHGWKILISYLPLLGKVAWNKLLDIFFHIMFECMDGRSEQFF